MAKTASNRLRYLTAAFLGSAFASLSIAPAAAETHAVIVGINDYLNVRHLKGAVNDANDIYAVLTKAGVKDVVRFVDAAATRNNVLNAIDQVIANAHKDDLVIIAFSGHGTREVWGNVHPPGTNATDTHEVFLLYGVKLANAEGKVDPNASGSAGERIFGVEMAMRLKRLESQGVRTIFVADTCHSGGLTRDIAKNASETPDETRFVEEHATFAPGVDPLEAIIPKLSAPIDTDRELRSLSFLAAVDNTHKAPEVQIPKGSGIMRGALSYAFARAIEGQALRGNKNEMTQGELVSFALASIKNSVLDNGKGQEPDLRPNDNLSRVVVKFGSDLTLSSNPTPTAPITNKIRIFSRNGKPVDPVNRPERGFGIEPAGSLADADLDYDAASGDLFSKGGDLIANKLRPTDLDGAAEREVAIRRLVEIAKPRLRPLALDRGDRRYAAGAEMALDARRIGAPSAKPEYYTLIIISGNGKVQFEYPLAGDSKTLPTDSALAKMQAGEPFGADYAVFVSDEKPLDGLIKSLCQIDAENTPNMAVNLIERSLTPTMQIGLQAIYTEPRSGAAPAAGTYKKCDASRL